MPNGGRATATRTPRSDEPAGVPRGRCRPTSPPTGGHSLNELIAEHDERMENTGPASSAAGEPSRPHRPRPFNKKWPDDREADEDAQQTRSTKGTDSVGPYSFFKRPNSRSTAGQHRKRSSLRFLAGGRGDEPVKGDGLQDRMAIR